MKRSQVGPMSIGGRPPMWFIVGVCVFWGTWSTPSTAAAAAADPYEPDVLKVARQQHPSSEAAVKAGSVLYARFCSGCHGPEGKGDGGSAPYLEPAPRNLAMASCNLPLNWWWYLPRLHPCMARLTISGGPSLRVHISTFHKATV